MYIKNIVHAHLNFASLNHSAVKTFACSLRIATISECYKTESLHARTEQRDMQ